MYKISIMKDSTVLTEKKKYTYFSPENLWNIQIIRL